jgi:cytochrome P450
MTGAGGTTVTGSSPPAVSAHCLLELLLEPDPDPLRLLTRCAEEPGEIVQIPFGRSTGYLLSNPQHVAEVLVAQAATFSRDRVFVERFSPLLGRGLITAEPADWRPQRRAVQAALQRLLPRLAGTTVALTKAMIDGYAPGEVRDLASDAADLHWRVLSTVVLGGTPGPAPAGDAGWHALKAALPQCPAHDGVAGALAPATEPEHLRDELTTLLFAGRDTSTSAITWTLGALARHGDVQERVRAELRAALGGAAPGLASIRALAFLEHVVKESLRLYPPTVFFTRDADADVALGRYTIPAGGTVILSPWITHRDARVFLAPLAFRPDRWQEANGGPRAGYFPFGAGPRMCVGRSAALLEISLVVATVLQRLRLTVEPGRWPSPTLRTTLSPEPALPVRVEAVAA